MLSMKNIVAIILARGGSKGIPRKNLMNFCGKPLVYWSVQHALDTKEISSVWVSSDSDEILKTIKKYGANPIKRPKNLSTDTAQDEEGYLHAINEIEANNRKIDLVVALQPTSPIRESSDIKRGIKKFTKANYDSMFSCAIIGDFYIWEKFRNKLRSINYDYKNRTRRQQFKEQYVENGSFYIFKPNILKKYNNRLGGNIGITLMEFWKSFEIDEMKDVKLCELIMKHYLLKDKQ